MIENFKQFISFMIHSRVIVIPRETNYTLNHVSEYYASL